MQSKVIAVVRPTTKHDVGIFYGMLPPGQVVQLWPYLVCLGTHGVPCATLKEAARVAYQSGYRPYFWVRSKTASRGS